MDDVESAFDVDFDGEIPETVETVFDLFWRANERNMRLVLQDLAESGHRDSEPVEIEVEPP
ncbi:hypothetical protein BRC60_11635 [Halobacteriales archaeon QH_1_68_42]|nr:MAG: hypothetical protein BRC60_11635 [Halobacteriales archaeon QH_1_68_42]